MSFKFTLLGLEFSNCNKSEPCESISRGSIKMAKKKLTPQQKKFKSAQAKCHKETSSSGEFGTCMSEKLTKKKSKSRSKKN